MKMQAVVLIIVHKSELSELEKASLAQCYKVLGRHPIRLVCPRGLRVEAYREVVPQAQFEFVDPRWQSSYARFNRLKIAPLLYWTFRDYRFILFYELDAWVFRDELDLWCEKGYDFIGAPWFEGWHEARPDSPFLGVGNGGFSLRHVGAHLRALTRFCYIRKPAALWSAFRANPSLSEFPGLLADLLVRNNTFYPFNDFAGNEDYFWTRVVAPNTPGFRLPTKEEALRFSVETIPSVFIKSEADLPFGCHGWWRYEPALWASYIPVLKRELFDPIS